MSFGFGGKEYELVFNGETYEGTLELNMSIKDILEEHQLINDSVDLDKNYDIRVDNIKRPASFKFEATFENENPIITVTPKVTAGN